MQTNLVTANDNSPDDAFMGVPSDTGRVFMHGSGSQAGDLISVSKYSPVKRGVRIQNAQVPAPVSTEPPTRTTKQTKREKIRREKTGKFPVYVLLLLWLVAVVAIARFAGGMSNNLLSGQSLAVAGGGLGLLSLALAATARKRHAKISHSIGIAGACVCTAGLIWYYLQQSGIKIPPEFLALGLAAGSLVLAKLWRTPFLLHLSLLLAIGWSSYSFLNTQVSELAWLFPALWSMQMFLALEFRIRRTIMLSIFTGLLWIGVNLFLLA